MRQTCHRCLNVYSNWMGRDSVFPMSNAACTGGGGEENFLFCARLPLMAIIRRNCPDGVIRLTRREATPSLLFPLYILKRSVIFSFVLLCTVIGKCVIAMETRQQYNRFGYGHDMNKAISCRLFSHIFRQMDQHIKTNRYENCTACCMMFTGFTGGIKWFQYKIAKIIGLLRYLFW